MIYVIDDDEIMARCIARACTEYDQVQIFFNAITAMQAMADKAPDLIFLDILLDGPDGFTLLNELVSYPDTAKVPVIVVTSLDLTEQDLSAYGVVGVLNKDKMTPLEIKSYAIKYCGEKHHKNDRDRLK